MWLRAVVAMMLAGCLEDSLQLCGDLKCPASAICMAGRCAQREQVEACVDREPGARCALAGIGEGICREQVCIIPRCGDGYLDVTAGEACDDGNADDSDGCARDCRSDETCGNGVRDPGEQCDDGNVASGDGCQETCLLPVCGDGVIDGSLAEQCDEGALNANTSDRCRTSCRLPYCGDSIQDVMRGEACDDSNLVAGDGCTPDCSSDESCGNGLIDPFTTEQCDDGNVRNRDGCSPSCQPETVIWTRQDLVPPAYQGQAVTYDSVRHRVVLFGGFGNSAFHNDTWELDGGGWMQHQPGTSPPISTGGSLAFDSRRGRSMLVNGAGSTYGGGIFDWDGGTWLVVNGGPPPSMPIAYDPIRDRMIGIAPDPNDPQISTMWSYDGSAWTQSTPDPIPPARTRYSIAWDAGAQSIVVFGGFDDANAVAFDDTWDWDGTTWSQRAQQSAPSARTNAGLAFDEARGTLVLFGGGGYLVDTWEWTGNGWTQRTPATTTPPAMFNLVHHLVYDTERQRILFVPEKPAVQPWLWDGTDWAQLPIATTPSRRSMFPLVYQRQRDRVLLFGGTHGPTAYAETWEWDGGAWLQRAPSYPPPGRFYHAASYDETRDRVVMFGGMLIGASLLGDTWEWDGAQWLSTSPATSPSPRSRAQLAYDAISQRTILFGGIDNSGALGDTWAWDGSTWTPITVTPSPSNRGGQAMFHDPTRGGIVLFGEDTWLWTGTGWSQLDTVVAPGTLIAPTMAGPLAFNGSLFTDKLDECSRWTATGWVACALGTGVPLYRERTQVVYDPRRDRVLLFGGYSDNHNTMNDTWSARFESTFADQACRAEVDTNGDGRHGCQDTDCWAVCSPLCAPGATAGACSIGGLATPYCGDGMCSLIEDSTFCSSDCP